MFQETNTDDLYHWDGDSWNVVAGASAQVTFLDEDNFSSDSAAAVASQQSIKAYVASQVSGSQNVFSTIAVSGQDNVVADTTTDTLTLVAGSNMTITTTAGSDTVTFATSGSGTVTITDNESTAENNLITFVAGAATATGAHGLEMDGDLHYNPSTGTVTSTVFAGALTGNATTATTLATARTIGGTSFDGSANIAVDLAATATALASARTIGGTSFNGSANIVPATITVADTTDTTSFIALFESATGDLAPKTDAGITYNAGTGTLTATAFVGPITGDVSGNASGTAATVTGAAQTAITSVGTLTGLDLTSGDKTIFSTVGNNTLTIGASNTTVNIAGDLTVTGDATTFNTATVSVEDPLMILASNNNAADAVDIGFYGLYDTSGSLDLYSGLFRDASDSGKWKIFKDLQAAPTTVVDTGGTGYAVGTLVANVEGDITGSAGTATGLAGSATVLATGRTIGMTGDITWTSPTFNGSGNITAAAAITAGVIVNADVNASAAIVDTKLATIATANKVGLAALDIDGGTEIGANIVDADLFIIDDGAGGTNRKTLASRLKTYIGTLGDANEYSFKTISVSGQSNVVADTTTDTLTLVAGSNMTLTTTADQVTFAAAASGASESFAIAMAVAL
jgi:hypothetical protein